MVAPWSPGLCTGGSHDPPSGCEDTPFGGPLIHHLGSKTPLGGPLTHHLGVRSPLGGPLIYRLGVRTSLGGGSPDTPSRCEDTHLRGPLAHCLGERTLPWGFPGPLPGCEEPPRGSPDPPSGCEDPLGGPPAHRLWSLPPLRQFSLQSAVWTPRPCCLDSRLHVSSFIQSQS